jgi:dTDP-4-amino-4,6-dideoxygalactose transaminase
VLIDIDPLHYTMDPAELAEVLAHPPPGLPPIRAAIPVHLYGQAADMGEILPICRRHGVSVIEDCSQAHGATWNGTRLGTLGAAGTFSLYPTKNLGALGDGGVLATDDAELAGRIATLRQYGWRTHYVSEAAGVNSRLDELQAAILRVKLRHLDPQNARREAIAAKYDAALSGTPIRPPARRRGATHVFHQYVVRVPDRAAVQARLRADGIGTGVHYPVPVHVQPAYRDRIALGPAGCRASEIAAAEVLSVPMFPELTELQVAQVAEAMAGVAG